MNRKEVYYDIKETFGLIPTMFKVIPDGTLEPEWHLFKEVEWEKGEIPNKYRELTALAIAAAKGCRYGTFLHTEMARLFGASDAEIEEAVHLAKFSDGLDTYLTGMQVDFDQFKKEIREACEHIRTERPHILAEAVAPL